MLRTIALSLLLLVACSPSVDPDRVVDAPGTDANAAETAFLDPSDVALRKILQEETISFSIDAAPVDQALDFIRTLKNINVIVNDRIRADLEGSLVTLEVTDLEIDSALSLLLRLAGPDYTWMVRNGVVFVTDREGVRNDPVLRVHNLRDRPFGISHFVAPNLILKPAGSDPDEGQPLFR